ncbi:MAG: sorbosone dehydrogenase family protein, partial [Janthinobacterium lividum]
MRFSSSMPAARLMLGSLALAGLAGCGDTAMLPKLADTGPNPSIGAPRKSVIPTLHIAPAKGWPQGATPVPAEGLAVNALAWGLDHPRWLYVLPNGDVLVAESNAPAKAEPGGLKAWVQGMVMKRAGAGVPSPDRIMLLRDADGDGVAESR